MSAPTMKKSNESGPHLRPNSRLRDEFAMAALPSVIVAMSAMTKHQVDELADKLKVGQADALVAKLSYYYADAMLAERKKEPPSE